MNVELIGKPAFLADIRYGDFFYSQLGDRVRPCLKAFIVENETQITDYVVSFTPGEREMATLPRLFDTNMVSGNTAYRISQPAFRHIISDRSLLLKTEYWPKPGILIESTSASFLTIKSGRMAHKIMYLNISSGELVSSPPKAPFAFVTEWKIVFKGAEGEQLLVRFPPAKEAAAVL